MVLFQMRREASNGEKASDPVTNSKHCWRAELSLYTETVSGLSAVSVVSAATSWPARADLRPGCHVRIYAPPINSSPSGRAAGVRAGARADDGDSREARREGGGAGGRSGADGGGAGAGAGADGDRARRGGDGDRDDAIRANARDGAPNGRSTPDHSRRRSRRRRAAHAGGRARRAGARGGRGARRWAQHG